MVAQFEQKLRRYLRLLFLFGTLRRIFLVLFLIQLLTLIGVLPIDQDREDVLTMMIASLLAWLACTSMMNRLTNRLILSRIRQ